MKIRNILTCCAYALLCASATAHAQDWKPSGPIELIAGNAPGGGADRILRIFVKVLGNHVATPAAVVNKPGGGGALAYHYLNQHAGDAHYLALASRTILTNNIVGQGPSYATMTPIMLIFTEYISVNVKPVSPIQSGKLLVEFMKRDPSVISFGIATSIGGMNHQGAAVALKAAGVDLRRMKNVIFPSGGTAVTAMLGGHVDVVPISAAFGASLVRNKQVRMIAVTSPRRLSGIIADVPTWKEQGYDVEIESYRFFVGPRGMTPAQIAFWERTIERATQSEEWKKELAENFWEHKIIGHAELGKFLAQDNGVQKAFLAGIGLSK